MFGSKRTIKVYSTVYNLAGDINERPNFLKTLMMDQTLFKTYGSYAQAITSAYSRGAGIKMRGLVPYANRMNYYDLIGQTEATVATTAVLSASEVTTALEYVLGYSISLYDHTISSPDNYWWAFKYLLENEPERINEIYDAELRGNILNIDFYADEEATEPFETIVTDVSGSEIDPTGVYFYAQYSRQTEPGLIDEEDYPSEEVDEFYDVTGWGDPISDLTPEVVYEWEQITHVRDVYDDWEEEQEFVVPVSESRTTIEKTYEKFTDYPTSEDNLNATRTHETVINTNGYILVPEVTETVTDEGGFTRITTVYDFRLEEAKLSAYNIKTYEVSSLRTQEVLIYKKGSGIPVFDDLFASAETTGSFFPVIPVKFDADPGEDPDPVYIDENSTEEREDIYKANVKLMKRVADRKTYNGILNSLKDNPEASGINYAYIFYGSSLNSPSNTARKYMLEFFRFFGDLTPTSYNNYLTYEDEYTIAHTSRINWVAWYEAQSNPSDPLYGTPQPAILSYPKPPERTVSFNSLGYLNLHYTINWDGTRLSTGSGMLPDMKVGDVKVTKGGDGFPEINININGDVVDITYGSSETGSGTSFTLTHQKSKDEWETITVYGLYSNNVIRRGRSVRITSSEALDDTEESGLLIPLHETVFRSLSLVDATQFGNSSAYLMLNYYAEHKQSWYETRVFRYIMIVVVIVISVFTFGAGGAAGGAAVGSMGGAAAAAVGLTGVAAAIFAMAVNAIAGMVISRLISMAAVEIFGEKIGMIVGVIVSMIAMNAMNSYFSGTPVNIMDSFTAQNILEMTKSVGQQMTQQMQAETQDIVNKMQEHREEFEAESSRITAMFQQEFGNQGILDLEKLMNSTNTGDMLLSSPSTFLERTLLTGSEIADITMNAIAESINLDYQTNLML